MHLLAVGLNHRTAPVEIRERCTFQPEQLPEAYRTLLSHRSLVEAVIVATCNRTELYLVTDRRTMKAAEEEALSFMMRWFRLPADVLRPHLVVLRDREAVRHLFRVAAGLDSMVLGETEILGQVREAWETARAHRATGKLLNVLFQRAIAFAKRAHTTWRVNDRPLSVAYVAIGLARTFFGDLASKRVLVVGAGETGRLLLQHFADQGVRALFIANRTPERAEELARRFGARAVPFERRVEIAREADVVATATSAPEPIFTRPALEAALGHRERPLLFLDLAVPRNVDPALHGLGQVFVYDIDDLQSIVEENLAERRRIAAAIERTIDGEVAAYERWLETLDAVPVIAALQAKGMALQAETMESLLRKLPPLDERSRRILEKHTKNLVNRLLQDAVLYLKETAGTREGRAAQAAIVQSFRLEPYLAARSGSEEETGERPAPEAPGRDPRGGGVRLVRRSEPATT
ncbi:MAG: glutamyl-tRNA reductase [Hydrogenibacillus schlegelii]|nr:glutamyl-tRNA reductase [Hydrogenibacillus schlegelii]